MNHFCEAYKIFYSHADKTFKNIANDFLGKNKPTSEMTSKLQENPDLNEIGRNDPCNCGSGKKYKKCCGK